MKRSIYFKLFTLILGISVLGISCQKSSKAITPIKQNLAGTDTLCPLSIYTKYLEKKAQRIHVIENHILIENPTDCGDLTIYNIETGELQSHLFKKDQPTFRYSGQSQFKGTVALYGTVTKIFYEYNFDNGLISFGKATNLYSKNGTPQVARRLADDLFAGISTYRDGPLALLDKKNKTMTCFGKYPLNEPLPLREHEYNILQHYRGAMDVSDDKKHIVYVSKTFGYMACYKYKNRKMSLLWEKRLTDNVYTRKRDILTFAPEHRKGFNDVRIINNHIYAIYDGNPYKPEKDKPSINNKVLVYDLEGRLLAEYTIPQELEYIDTDAGEKFLYATVRTAAASQNNEPIISMTLSPGQEAFPATPDISAESYLIRYPLPILPNAE